MRNQKSAIGLLLKMIASALALAAQTGYAAPHTTGLTAAEENAFRTAFRQGAISQCLSGTAKLAAAGLDMTPSCTCAADTLVETKSLAELIAYGGGDQSKVDMHAIVQQCLKTHPPVRQGAAAK